MKKLIPFIVIYIIPLCLFAQNKSDHVWIVGNNASFGKFDGTANPPFTGSLYTMAAPNYPYLFTSGHSNICDSATGNLLFLCNGMVLYDTLGNIMSNGDNLVPNKIYTHNAYPSSAYTQGSLILPKGNNREFYIFIPTVSDTTYDWYWTGASGLPKAPFDMLYYNIVDMNANAGSGSVVVKNKKLLHDVEMNKVMMQACRHSNGRDWWLLKQGGYDKNEIIRFLVTKDSIYGPYYQLFANPKYSFRDLFGQMAFSKDGKKYCAVQGNTNQIFIADFDRCSGELSNPKVFNIPIDSTTIPNPLPQYLMDSLSNGVCFSPNGKYIYLTRRYNIYQFEYDITDSALAWVRIKHGPDTSYQAFEAYGQLYKGPDERIYIGKIGGSHKQFSVIDYPDNKGLACGFCRKCFRVDSALGGLNAPPNMPDYNLGADLSKPCWPLYSSENFEVSSEMEVWPNPAHTTIHIKSEISAVRELYNSMGQLLFSTSKNEIAVSRYCRGIYYIKVGQYFKKLIIE